MSAPAATAPEPSASLSISSLASGFLGAGLALVLLETLYFQEVAALAKSSYGPRAIIGFHLFFSEIWFIVVGNALVVLLLVKQNFRFHRELTRNSSPIALIFTVYTVWFVYGSLAGNDWALQEFREMVFNALCLPPVLYFAARADLVSIFRKFVFLGLPVVVVASLFAAHNSVLMAATFIVAYFTFRLLYGSRIAIAGLAFSILPFFVRFEKPTIALLGFTLFITSVLAGHLNPTSRNWILSRFKLRIVAIALALVLAVWLLATIVNSLTGGLIEEAIRFHFLKIRLTTAGEIQQGDLSGGRLAIWTAALADWQSKPFLGHGLGASVNAFSAGWVTKVQYHNYLIQALHNTGLIGATLIVGAWILWLRRAIRRVHRLTDPGIKLILACMLVYILNLLFYGLYGHSLSFPPTAQLFWVCVGVLCVVNMETHPR
jgi:O-antigen ligase